MYYIEGIIDAIDVCGVIIRFSLLPSNAHLLSLDGGTKKVLFIGANAVNATMINPEINTCGKEIVWFSPDKRLLDVLLAAKNNRNTIRVWCKDPKPKEPATKEPFPHPKTIKVVSARVF